MRNRFRRSGLRLGLLGFLFRGRRLAVLTALAAGVALVLVGSAAAAQAYGVSVSKGCVSPIDVGDVYVCTAELDNNDSISQDTVRWTSLDDEVDSSTGAHAITIPINSSTPGLTLLNLGGGLPTCDATGCTLPYNTGLEVTSFSHYVTVVGDFPNVSDTATYHWNDTCQFTAPGTTCSTGPKSNEAGASADINPLATGTTTSISSGGNSGVTAVEIGSSVTDSVTVSGPADQPAPTGDVSVSFYSTINCTGNPVDTASTETLDANGQALNVHPEGPLPAGLFGYRATYLGDGPYSRSTGACEPLRVVDANIQITPANAANEVRTNHDLTGHVNVNDGSGSANAPDGRVINFSLSNAGGATAAFVGPSSCTTSGGTGSCTVTISSPTPGSTSIGDTTTVSVAGVSLTRSSGDGLLFDSAAAHKNWVDANIQITPADATNPAGTTHLLTGHVNVNAGSGQSDAPDGTSISFTIDSGPGSFTTANPCITTGGTGSCQITLTSATAGRTIVSAHVTASVGGVALTRSTNGFGGNSSPATKDWADASVATHVRDASGNDVTGSTSLTPGTVVHDEATVLRTAATPAAVPNPTGIVTFTLFSGTACGGSVLATDPNKPLNASGLASTATFTTPAAGGSFSYLAQYSGDANYPARDAGCEAFTVAQLVDVSLSKSGPLYAAVGIPVPYTLTVGNAGPAGATNVVVTDSLPAGMVFQSATTSQGTFTQSAGTVTFTVGSLSSSGTATLTVTATPTTTGSKIQSASVTGDQTDSNPANNSAQVTTQVAGFAPGGGAFVIGDRSTTGRVTFWSPMWSSVNQLSGGTAPSAFKGFAPNPASPTCAAGAQWNTGAGTSPPPPSGPLPSLMAVIVTDKATKSGKTIKGTIVHIVIVSTNAGYNPATGGAGTGTVLRTAC